MKGRDIQLEMLQVLLNVGEYQGLPTLKLPVCASMTLFSCLWTERWSLSSSILRLFLIIVIEEFQGSIVLSSTIKSCAQGMSGSCQCFLKVINTFSVGATIASVILLGFLICKISQLFLLDFTHFALHCFGKCGKLYTKLFSLYSSKFPFDLF